MSLPKYPEYRSTGVPWLGEIPIAWEVVPLKRLLEIQNGADHKHVEVVEGVPVIGSGGVFAFASASMYEGESVLLGRKGTIDKPLYVNGPFWTVDTMYWSRVTQEANARFAYYAAMTIPFDYYSTNTALPSMTKAALNSHLVALPTLEEQSQIAAHLDRETAKIDDLIAEQERLLALLTEKRQAVISNAITKGLNPDVPVRESGVEWLGSVPSHWRIGKARFYVSVLPGFAFPSHGFSSLLEDMRLLRGVNVGVGRLRWDDVVYWKREEGDGLDRYELAVGDVVIGMDRPLIGEGMRVATVQKDDVPCLLLQRVAKVIPGREILGSFIERLLASGYFEAHFTPETTGVSVPHISGDQISNFVIPVPPVKEQREICDFIDLEIGKIEKLIEQALRMVDLLRERRAALISSVVTGQVDVREVA